MNRLVCWLLFTLSGIASTISPASASVIYDVTQNYADGYQYSFSMEFANATGYKFEQDLIGEFENEQFTQSGVSWTLVYDFGVPVLGFDPINEKLDIWYDSNGYSFGSCITVASITNAGFQLRCGEEDLPLVRPVGAPVVTLRVPEPASLALLVLGLAGLGFSRRKQA